MLILLFFALWYLLGLSASYAAHVTLNNRYPNVARRRMAIGYYLIAVVGPLNWLCAAIGLGGFTFTKRS